MKENNIKIHEKQSTIFDIVEDTTTNNKQIQLKTNPPYHKDLFPNVKLIKLTDKCTLALKAIDNRYTIDFVYHLSPTSFIVYYPLDTLKVHKVSNTLEKGNRDYLCKDFAKFKHIDTFTTGVDYSLEKALEENDFDEIFNILSKL